MGTMSTRKTALTLGVLAVLGVGGYLTYRWAWAARDSEDPAEVTKLAGAKLELPAVASAAAGWPQWRGPTRDGRAPVGPFRTDWDKNPPKLLWQAEGGGGYGSCAVAAGRVYVQYRKTGQDVLMCLDPATGQVRWETGAGADYSDTDPTYATGPRATPAVEGDRVWAVDGAGHLRCYHTDEPERPGLAERWHVDLLKEFGAMIPRWGVACSPLIEGDLVIVQPGGKKGSVAALDKRTGSVRWAAGRNPPSYSSPVAATVGGRRVVFALTGDRLLAIRPEDGEVTDSYPWKPSPEVNVATPLVIDDYVFISAAYEMGWALLRAEPTGDGVRLAKVRERRGVRAFQNHHSTSVYKDRHLFGFSGMDGGRLKCLDIDTGAVKADWDAVGVGKGTVILAGNHLVVQTERGELCLVEATPDEFRLVAKVPTVLTKNNTWATPTLVDGRLFLRDEEKVACYDVR